MTPGTAGSARTAFPRIGARVPALLLGMLLAALLAVSAGAAPAWAHAQLLGTAPADGDVLDAAPAAAELRFDETVRPIDGQMRLFPRDGRPVVLDVHTRGRTVVVDLPQNLPEGAYTVSYRVVSADGHPVGGAITFRIGAGSDAGTAAGGDTVEDAPASAAAADPASTPAATERAVSVLTAVQYLALLVLAGLIFFRLVVLRPAGPPGRAGRLLLRGALAGAVLAALLLVPVSGLRVTGNGLGAILSVEAWRPGVLRASVLGAAIIVLVGTGAVLLEGRARSRAARAVAVLLAAAAAAVPVLTGHSRSVAPPALMAAADIGHLLAGAFWIGGLLGLLLLLTPGARGREGRGDPAAAARVMVRFSRAALYAVALLAVSGTTMALLILDEPGQLLSTGYGRTLLAKLCVVATVVVLAAGNRRRLLPSILARPTARARWARLRRLVSYEAALLVAVVAITGQLSTASPDHDHHGAEAPTPAVVSTTSQGLRVEGTLSPAAPGPNTLTVDLHHEGHPAQPGQVEVSATLPEEELGPITAQTTCEQDTGRCTAQLDLPVAGQWQLRITDRVSRFQQPIAIIPVTIG